MCFVVLISDYKSVYQQGALLTALQPAIYYYLIFFKLCIDLVYPSLPMDR